MVARNFSLHASSINASKSFENKILVNFAMFNALYGFSGLGIKVSKECMVDKIASAVDLQVGVICREVLREKVCYRERPLYKDE